MQNGETPSDIINRIEMDLQIPRHHLTGVGMDGVAAALKLLDVK